MGASATHLLKFDTMQKLAERMNDDMFPAHQSHCAVSAVEIPCKLLDFIEMNWLNIVTNTQTNKLHYNYID